MSGFSIAMFMVITGIIGFTVGEVIGFAWGHAEGLKLGTLSRKEGRR